MSVRTVPVWVAAVIVLYIAAAFLLVNAWQLHMHPDEELSYRSTNGDLAFTIYFQTSVQDNQAPVWFVLFWVWRQLVGDAEYTSRVLGVLFVLPALAVTYRLGRIWFGFALVGLVAPLLLLGVDLFFNYALDIRPYPLVMLCAALSMWAFTRWVNLRSTRSAVLYGLSVALLLYVHYLLVFLVAAQGIYYLFTQPLRLRHIRQATLALGVGFALWFPWMPTFLNQINGLRKIELETGTARGAAGIGVSTQATSFDTVLVLLNSVTNGLLWLYGALLLIGFALLWRKKSYWLALAWAVGAPVVTLLANLFVAVYAPRFVSHALFGWALLLAAGLIALPRRLGMLAVAGVVAANLLTFPTIIPDRIPYRDLYGEMSAQGRFGDVVLMAEAGEDDGFVDWQLRHYLSPELHTSAATDPARVQDARRIWFMTGDWFDPAVRQQFDALEQSHPVQQVLGQCDNDWCYLVQLMEAPPLTAPVSFGEILDFWGADVDAVTDSAISTRLWWRVGETPALDYSFSLRLLDNAGAILAQNDGPVHHYGAEIFPTSQLQPGKIYIDWRNLSLPGSLPTGTYRLELVVYQTWNSVRLRLPDASDALLLQELTIS